MAILGHSDIRTTENIYTHPDLQQGQEAMDKMGPGLRQICCTICCTSRDGGDGAGGVDRKSYLKIGAASGI